MNALYASGIVIALLIILIVFMNMFANSGSMKQKAPDTIRSLVKKGARYLETSRNTKNPLLRMINSNYAIACFKNAQAICSDDFIQSQCNVDILSLIQKAEAINDKSIQAVNSKGKFMKSDNISVASCFT